jgi:hypothetical protein
MMMMMIISEDNIAFNFFARENNTFHFLSSDARSSSPIPLREWLS